MRQDVASERQRTNGPSALSGIKANPEMWKLIRDQQKMGMGSIYKDFATKLNLPTEQAEKLNELLADNVMENIDHITAVLRDGMTPAQMEPIFAGQEAAMLEKIQELLGPEDRAAAENVCVRKLHTYSGEPFCYAEIYVPTSIFESLPKDSERKRKLLAAVLDELGPRCRRVRQRMTVMPADFPLCDMLKVPFASPVAMMSRRLVDSKGNLLYAGVTWYRGDRYVSEIDFPVSALKTLPGITEPQPRVGGERSRG